MDRRIAVTLAGLALLICGCAHSYVGDGTLHDAGPFAADNRFVLDLGPIDLSARSESTYHLSRLPQIVFTLGFYIVALDSGPGALYDTKLLKAVVRIEMTNEHGEPVIAADGPLPAWTWSGSIDEQDRSFVYRAGDAREVPVRRSVTTYVRLGELADSGWGTYFRPRKDGAYTLKLSVVHPDPEASRFRVTMQAQGGGWK